MRVTTLAVVVLVLVIGFIAAKSVLSGPAPPMSLVPALPDDANVVRNETESSDGAGGNSARVLILRSESRSPNQLATDVAAAFDRDPQWQRNRTSPQSRSWELPPAPCEPTRSSTTASVEVVTSGGEVEVGQYDTVVTDVPAVVLRISTFDHVFCKVGTSVS